MVLQISQINKIAKDKINHLMQRPKKVSSTSFASFATLDVVELASPYGRIRALCSDAPIFFAIFCRWVSSMLDGLASDAYFFFQGTSIWMA